MNGNESREDAPALEAGGRRRAGHYEILGETYAKFEFFENGWNPYSRFLDVDKVDFILRSKNGISPVYREVQVKYGKLYRCGAKWEQELFDISSWRFFKETEFQEFIGRRDFFIAYVLAEDIGYRGDIFLFPVDDFVRLVKQAISSGNQRKMYLSRLKDRDKPDQWFLRKQGRFSSVDRSSTEDVSMYRRNFAILK